MQNNNTKTQATSVSQKNKPNDSAGFYFSSFVKIFDANSKEILVQKRGDD
jgi:hypothetical protein